MKVVKWLDEKLEETFLVVMLILIACITMVQVVIRKIPGIPSFTWAEEFCRFCWIWSVFISLPYTIRKNNMLRVGVLMDLLPQMIHKVVNIIVDVIVMGSMAILAYNSIDVIKGIIESGETSPAMVWPMWVVYSFMFIGFAMATLRGLQMIVIHIQHFNEKELSTMEQTMADAAAEAEAAEG